MKAMILAAGYGKRLLPLTKETPKPLLKVGNKTLIQHNIEHLIKNAGLDENKANKEADAMINKKRTVSENDYALLDDGTFELKYYQYEGGTFNTVLRRLMGRKL